MHGIVPKLRALAALPECGTTMPAVSTACVRKAANEIVRLRKENDQLKKDNMRLMDEISHHENRE